MKITLRHTISVGNTRNYFVCERLSTTRVSNTCLDCIITISMCVYVCVGGVAVRVIFSLIVKIIKYLIPILYENNYNPFSIYLR